MADLSKNDIERNLKISTQQVELMNDSIEELDTIVRYQVDSKGNNIHPDEVIESRIKLIKSALDDNKELQRFWINTAISYNNQCEDNKDMIDIDNTINKTVSKENIENNNQYQDTPILVDYITEDINKDIIKTVTSYNYVDKPLSVTNESDKQTHQNIINNSNQNTISEPINHSNYDIIPLPSKGECYKNKITDIAISYLNAYDENLITSMNLYYNNMFIESLLKEKVLSKDILYNELIKGDVDAILLWLRVTGYGNMYPVEVTDPETKETFETEIDLSKIKVKDFNLKGDDNGYFTFNLPLSNDIIKFKYLSIKEERLLNKLSEVTKEDSKKNNIIQAYDIINDNLQTEIDLTDIQRQKLNLGLGVLKEWSENITPNPYYNINKTLTNRMELSIVSVNGNTDRVFIHNYIKQMRTQDSLALRKYMINNEPGLDLNVTIEKPETLGGGSFDTFCSIDQFIFLHIQ